MPSNSLGDALFDDIHVWVDSPGQAFDSLLSSGFYLSSSRSIAKQAEGSTVRASSARVYRVMFNRYLEFLSRRGATFVEATPELIGDFIHQELSAGLDREAPTRDTKQRYIRLIERAYERAFARGAVQLNPVTAHLQEAGRPTGANSLIPAEVDPEKVKNLTVWLAQNATNMLAVASNHAEHSQNGNQGATQAPRHASLNRGSKETRALWRQGRDMAIAALSLGSGMRCTEIVALVKNQVTYRPDMAAHDRFSIRMHPTATVATAMDHTAKVSSAAAEALEAWWQFRFGAMESMLEPHTRQVVFPSGLNAKPLKEGTLYVNLKPLAKMAVAEGVIPQEYSWILETGATGLRRAYILASLLLGASEDQLSRQLGHQNPDSIRRYRKQNARIRKVQEVVSKQRL